MLLTGLDNHRGGASTIEEILPPDMRNRPGYRLRIEPEVLTIAERLRAARAGRARELGLLPPDAATGGFSPDARGWDALSPAERRIAARSMEVYAGMIEAADAAVGRLIARLEARGELANTLFVVTSDNGPEPSDPVHQRGMGLWMGTHGYSWRLEGLGGRGSLNYIGREWAEALASPGRRYKFYVSEGGIRAPLIISGAGVPPGQRIDDLTFVTDVTPTLADFAGTEATPEAPAMDGTSLRTALEGAPGPVRGPDAPLGIEVSGNAALYRGDYKIVRDMPPLGDGRWRLYDVARDPGETRDLSGAEPERLKAMLADYAAYEARVGVAPLPPGYTTQKQLTANALAKQVPVLAAGAALIALLLGGGGFLAWRSLRRRRREAA